MPNVLTEQQVQSRFGPWFRYYAVTHLGMPQEAYNTWLQNEARKYHCVFCGWHGEESHFPVLKFPYAKRVEKHRMIGCPRCREYKGLEPCIEGFCAISDLGFGGSDFPRT